MAIKKIILFSMLTFLASPAWTQHTYYVDPGASMNGDGSRAHPFRTLAEVNSIMLIGGDRVLFRPGSVVRGTLSPRFDTTVDDGAVFLGTESDSLPATIVADSTEAIKLIGSRNVTISNLHLSGPGRKTGSRSCGLLAWRSTRIYLLNVEVNGFQKAGLGIYGCSMVVAYHVMSHDNGSAGIEVGGSDGSRCWNIMIKSCQAWSNPGDPTNFENHSGNGIVVGQANLVEISDCTAWDNGAEMPRIGNGPVGIWAWEADSVEIHHCVSYGNHTSKGSSDGGGFDLDGGVAHAWVHHNLSHDNEGSGIGIFQYWGASAWHDNVVEQNYSINDATRTEGAAGILVWSSDTSASNMRGLELRNNTIVTDLALPIRYHVDSRHLPFNIHHNSFFGPGPIPVGDPGRDAFSHNKWCGDGTRPKVKGIARMGSGCGQQRALETLREIRTASDWRRWIDKGEY